MADEIYLRFYEELNDYLPLEKRKREFAWPLHNATRVRSMLGAVGVPVSEVEFVLVNGSSAGLSRLLSAGDRVSVYPVFESFNVKTLLRFRKKPLRQTRFLVDSNLPQLTHYLRLLGLDAPVNPGPPEHAIHLAEEEHRILLTADPAFSKHPELTRVYVVRQPRPVDQLKEVFARFDLMDEAHILRFNE